MPAIEIRLTTIEETLSQMTKLLGTLVTAKMVKDFYSVEEVAEISQRSEYQVRVWLRDERIIGTKRASGRGRSKEWAVSHEELTRYQNHGLRPASSK